MRKKFFFRWIAVAMVLLCIFNLGKPVQAAGENDLTFTLNKDKKGYTVSGCDQAATGELVIPETYGGLPVTAIGVNAFDKCYRLTAVVIPDSVTSIGKAAFFSCSGLTEVTLSKGITALSESAFNGCVSLNYVTIPEGVTRIEGYAFTGCSGLTGITIPDSVTVIGAYAFSDCKSLTDVTIPNSVTSIGEYAFARCPGMTSVTIPSSVTSIGIWAFNWCSFQVDENNPAFSNDAQGVLFNQDKTVLVQARGAVSESYVIPHGTTEIFDWAFYSCSDLTAITIPDSVTQIGDYAFRSCSGLTDIYYTGTENQWNTLLSAAGTENSPLYRATVHYNYVVQRNTLVVFTDRTDLRIGAGDSITLRAGAVDAEGKYADPSGITFQVTDNALVDVMDHGFEGDCLYIQLRGVNPGTTTVTFSDTKSGYVVAVPITVFENTYPAYTLNNIPEISAFGLTANFANFNGLYIDSFGYRLEDDRSTRITFDAYNTNYTYGLVEVYRENGQLYNLVLIDKMTNFNTSLKEVYWDGSVCFVRALADGSISNYRGGFVSKLTHVEVDVPKNGYIKITCDPAESDLVALVNYAHLLASSLSLVGEVDGFDPGSMEFPEALTQNLLKDTAAAQFREDGSKAFAKVMKNEIQDLTITASTVGDFAETLTRQMIDFKGMELVTKSLAESGADFTEDVFTKMLGKYGTAIKTVFIIGKCENLVLSYNDAVYTIGGGAITIQNQGGGVRAANHIQLESEVDFAPDVALQTYSVELDEEFLEFVRQADRETYDILTGSICHTWEISLLRGEEKVQHSGYVTVYIPIPKDLQSLSLEGNIKVYRIEEDGLLTDMDAVVEDGCMRFVTDHFSLYTLVGKGVLPGDLDGNGAVNQDDVVYLLLHTMFGEAFYPIKNAPADVDGNGTVNQDDAVYLLLHTMFGENFYPIGKK